MGAVEGMIIASADDSTHVRELPPGVWRAGRWSRWWSVLRPLVPEVLALYGVLTSFVIGPILAVILGTPAVLVSGVIAWLLSAVLHHCVPYFSDDYHPPQKASRRSIGQVSKHPLMVKISRRLTEPPVSRGSGEQPCNVRIRRRR